MLKGLSCRSLMIEVVHWMFSPYLVIVWDLVCWQRTLSEKAIAWLEKSRAIALRQPNDKIRDCQKAYPSDDE
jgi:hypothetical protein